MPRPTEHPASAESTERGTGAERPVPAPETGAALAEHGLELRHLASPWETGDADPDAPFDHDRRWADHPAVRRHTAVLQRNFHEVGDPDLTLADRFIGVEQGDRRRLSGVYPQGSDPAETDPVGTLADFTKDLNTGGGHRLPAWCITEVTVSPTHRRRGILRAMMTETLRRGAAAGAPLALLTATEATIYRRFGFGVSTYYRSVWVDVTRGVQLRGPRPAGSFRFVEPTASAELIDGLWRRAFEAQPGSVERIRFSAARETDRDPRVDGGRPVGLRAVVFAGEDGQDRGVAVYRVTGDTSELASDDPVTATVVSLWAADADAHRALIEFLGNLDLVVRLRLPATPADRLLEFLVLDESRIHTRGVHHHLWHRILDVPACFAGRPYLHEGAVAVRVEDDLGHAAGTWEISARGGRGGARRVADDAAELTLDVAELGSVLLGGVKAEMMREAAILREHRPGAAADLDTLLRQPRPPYSLTSF